MFLEILQNSQENACVRVSFFIINCRPQACNFVKKEILTQAFSCEFCKISKNTFSYRAPPLAASDSPNKRKAMTQLKKHWKTRKMVIVDVHINIILLRLFVQLPISFPFLLFYGFVDILANLFVSFVLFLSYVSDWRELSLRWLAWLK